MPESIQNDKISVSRLRNKPFNQRLLLAIAILSGFLLLMFATLVGYVFALSGNVPSPIIGFLFEHHSEMMVATSVLGIIVGASVYFLMSEQVEVVKQESQINAELLLSFLSHDERAVVELLKDSEGHTTQAQLSKLPNMSRLKAHRVVLRLAERKIIRIEKLGLTNQLWLMGSIFDALKGGGQNKPIKPPTG